MQVRVENGYCSISKTDHLLFVNYLTFLKINFMMYKKFNLLDIKTDGIYIC